MRAATQKRWQAHVAAWTTSGLTCKAYAAKVRVNPRTLTWWKSKLGESATPASFVEVTSEIAATAEPGAGLVELAVGRVIVRLRGRFDADALTRLLDVLEARA
jgi:hypothetical protein